MPRVPTARREDLDEQGQAIYDSIVATRGPDFFKQGPYGVLMHSPEFANRAAHLGTYVRYEGPMPARHRHLLTLVIARELNCQYEFTAHAVLARKHGISDEAIQALGLGEDPTDLPEVEQLLVSFVRQLVEEPHRVDDATFEALRAHLGLPALTDVIGAIGYFAFAGYVLNAFEVEVREEQTPELPVRG